MNTTTLLVVAGCFLASLAFALGCKWLGDRNLARWEAKQDVIAQDIRLHLRCAAMRQIADNMTDPAMRADAFATIEQTERELGVVWPAEVL